MHIRWCKKIKGWYRLEFADSSQSELLVRLAALGFAKPFVDRRGVVLALVWDVLPACGAELLRSSDNGREVWTALMAGRVYVEGGE